MSTKREIYCHISNNSIDCNGLGLFTINLIRLNFIPGASPGFGRGGQEFFFFRFGNLHVAKRHAAHGKAMRFARGVRGHAPPPRKFF